MNSHQNGQWSSTTCTSTTSSSSLSQPLPASSAASVHLLTQPPPAVESRKTLVLASFQAQIEEEDKKPKLHAETDPLRTIPEFVVVRALPSTALKPNHNETDDYNIAHFKQTISRKMLSSSFPERNLECMVKINALAPDFFAPKSPTKPKSLWTVESVSVHLEALKLSTDEWWKASNIRHA
ncbi:hypothetical protein Pelo_1058, partial [Pelomyxa schiedti]